MARPTAVNSRTTFVIDDDFTANPIEEKTVVALDVQITSGNIEAVAIGATTPATVLYVDNLCLDGNTISSVDTDGAIILTPNGTGTITLNTAVDGTAVLDEDDMVSDSATKLATQQSIKAYVAAQITLEDLDVTADSGGPIAIDLDSETLTLAGGTGLDSVAATNTVTFNIDSTVATLTGTQDLSNKTLIDPVIEDGTDSTKQVSVDTSDLKTATTRTWSFPHVDSAVSFATRQASETLINKRLDEGVLISPVLKLPKIDGMFSQYKYMVQGADITRDIHLRLPKLTQHDEVVTKDATQVLTNKSIDGDTNTITGVATIADIIVLG